MSCRFLLPFIVCCAGLVVGIMVKKIPIVFLESHNFVTFQFGCFQCEGHIWFRGRMKEKKKKFFILSSFNMI